jgi:hypothetical protein
MHANQLWTLAAAARECGCCDKKLYAACRQKEVPIHPTACGRMLVTIKDVRKWIKSQEALDRR